MRSRSGPRRAAPLARKRRSRKRRPLLRGACARPLGQRGRGRTCAMTGLDWIIVAFAALLATFGFRRGFIVAVLSIAGFALGAFLGTRVGPLVLLQVSSSLFATAY